jgi:hypothetical protein
LKNVAATAFPKPAMPNPPRTAIINAQIQIAIPTGIFLLLKTGITRKETITAKKSCTSFTLLHYYFKRINVNSNI